MTSFEFVFGLISVITSLALTRLLDGCIALYRNADRVRWSWRHACWTVVAFMLLIGNWASYWRRHNQQAWDGVDLLSQLAFLSVLYAYCDLVMPEKPEGDELLDLRDFHQRQGKRYAVVQLVFAMGAMLVLAREATGFGPWLHAASFAMIAALLCCVALSARSVWLDTVAAVGLVVLAFGYMVSTLRVLSA